MNIVIIGYGKMGKMIEEITLIRNHNIVYKIDNDEDWNNIDYTAIDIAIDFSNPYIVVDNIVRCFNHNIPIVVGTTGWYMRYTEIKELAISQKKSIFVASNFSIGMFIFNTINKSLAKLMNNQPSYDISIDEIHHIHKLDSPSGTAIALAETIIDNLDRKTKWAANPIKEEENTIDISSERIGEVAGIHSVTYSSEIDDIIITHQAHSRKGFALGAVLAAEFIKDKVGFFTMQDMLY